VAERDRQRRLEIFARSDWQMSLGERAGLEGASQLIDGPGTPAPSVTARRIPLDAAHLRREPLQRELDAMHSSWSWRLTRLLRAVKVQLRGLTACRPRGSTDGRV
jgi:hypothetical protein